jgi:hypothetical protein
LAIENLQFEISFPILHIDSRLRVKSFMGIRLQLKIRDFFIDSRLRVKTFMGPPA